MDFRAIILFILSGGISVSLLSESHRDIYQNNILAFDTVGKYVGKMPKTLSFSNNEISGCNDTIRMFNEPLNVSVDILERRDRPKVRVAFCKIQTTVMYFKCDKVLKWIWNAQSPESTKTISISKDKCISLIEGKSISVSRRIQSKITNEIEIITFNNVTASRYGINSPILPLRGFKTQEGYCKEDKRSFLTGVLEGYVTSIAKPIYLEYYKDKISRKEYLIGEINLELNNITRGHIFHQLYGDIYLFNESSLPKDELDYYSVLLSTSAKYYEPKDSSQMNPILSINDDLGYQASFILKETTRVNNFSFIQTNQPNLFVYLNTRQNNLNFLKKSFEFNPIVSQNNKINTLMINLKKDIQTDFASISKQMCKSRLINAKNYLSLIGEQSRGIMNKINTANLLNDSFENGRQILNYGATTYLIEGYNLTGKIRKTNVCCLELPVTLQLPDNLTADVFIDAKSSNIKEYCTERICDPLFPYSYHVLVYNNLSQYENVSQYEKIYLCTYQDSVVRVCDDPPRSLSVELEKWTAKSTKMDTNSMIYNKTLVSLHQLELIRRLLKGAVYHEDPATREDQPALEISKRFRKIHRNGLRNYYKKKMTSSIDKAIRIICIVLGVLCLILATPVVIKIISKTRKIVREMRTENTERISRRKYVPANAQEAGVHPFFDVPIIV